MAGELQRLALGGSPHHVHQSAQPPWIARPLTGRARRHPFRRGTRRFSIGRGRGFARQQRRDRCRLLEQAGHRALVEQPAPSPARPASVLRV